MKLLVIEDDAPLCDVLRRGFSQRGHVVDVACDGLEGEQCALGGEYDAIVLDLNLPVRDGLTVLRTLRARGVQTPVLILTSRDTVDDSVDGLNAGAEDYVRKPFAFRELEARLFALTRRAFATEAPVQELRVGDVRLDLIARRAYRGARELMLTARELVFLEYFMRNAGRLVTRGMLEDALFNRDDESDAGNVIAVYVSRLRSQLCAAVERPMLLTVRGAGYRFGPPEEC